MHKLLLPLTARRWAWAAASLLGLLGSPALGQALNYGPVGATNVAGTFASIAATSTAIATANSDNANSAAQNIGFTFNFNGASFTQFVLSTNGFIKLGAAAPSSTTLFYTPETTVGGDVFTSTAAADVNIISPFNCDLESGTLGASYRVLTSGTAGNRVCTIQWNNVRDRALTNTTQYANFSFQAKLYEGSSRIEFVYGTATAGTGTDAFRFAGAGIKGSGSAVGQTVLFNKGSAQTWDLATALSGNYPVPGGNTLNYRQTVRPDAGRTFRFDPLTGNDLSIEVYTLGQVSQTFASPHAVRAVVVNEGGTATTARTATLVVAGVNALTTTQAVPALAPGASATLTFAAYPLTAAGTNTVTVSLPADDDNTNNTATSQQVVSTGRLAYTDPNPATAFVDGLGSGAAGSLLFVKYRANGTGFVTNITPTFFTSTVATTFQVLVYDASGAGGLPGAVLHTSGTQTRPATAGPVSVAVPNVAVTGDFYVATRQLATDNISLAYQEEEPLRPGTFYFSPDGLTFTDLSATTFPARLALETTLVAAVGAAPANNECSSAISLTPNATCVPTSGTTVGATQSLATIVCAGFTGASDDDVWYRFVANGPTHAVTVTGGAGFDAVVDVRGGACPGVNIGCADASGNAGTEIVNLTGLATGTTYYVRVYSYGTATPGTFTICVTNGAVAVCANPADVQIANVTSTSAQITFTPVAGNTSYTATYTPTGGTATTVTGTASPLSFTGLVPGTAYALTFQAVCAAGGTAPVLTGTFTTQAAPVPANDNPTGATVLPVNPMCVPTTSTNAGATTTPINGYTNPSTTPNTCGTAFSPKDVWFRFTTLAGQTAAGVFVSGTVAGSVRVFSAPNVGGPFTQIACTAGTTTNTQAPPVSLMGLSGNTTYYVMVSGFGSFDTQGSFTICVTGSGAAPCPAVTGLNVTNITTTTATIGYAAPANGVSYNITVTPMSGSVTNIGTVSSSVNVTGLNPGTTYLVSVLTNCAGGQTSATPATTTFTTAATPCPAVTGLTVSNVTATNATLTFAPATGASSYTVTYTPAGGTAQSVNATASPVTLTGLQSGAAYTVSILTNCAAGQTSATAATAAFTTLAPCPAVANLAAGNLSPTGATLTFNSFAGSTGFTVTLTPQGGAAATLTAAGSPVTLTGLTPGTFYTVGVVTNCAAGQNSGAVTTTFTTPFAPCPAVTNLAASNITTTGASLSFTPPAAGATGYTVTYTPQGGMAVTQTATGSPVTLAGLTPATLYAVVVRTNCAFGQASADVLTSFTTATPCTAVTSLGAGSVGTPGATLTFVAPAGGATSFTVAYTPAGGNTLTVNATGSPVVLAGLLPGTQYTATVTTNCAAGQTSPVASTTFATTSPVCDAATNAAVGSITTTGASLSFTPAAGATGYTVTLTPQGGTATTLTATGSPLALTGLLPGTSYTVSIVTNCAAGQASTMAATATFATTAPALAPPTNATVGNITTTGATVSFGLPAGATGYTLTYTPQGGTAVTVSGAAAPAVLTGLTGLTTYALTLVATYPGGLTSAPVALSFRTLMGTATRNALAGSPIGVFPNPAHRAFTLSLPALGSARTAQLVLLNALGQSVRRQTLALTPGGTQVQVEVATLATGLYTVRVQVGGEAAFTKLVVE